MMIKNFIKFKHLYSNDDLRHLSCVVNRFKQCTQWFKDSLNEKFPELYSIMDDSFRHDNGHLTKFIFILKLS